VVKAAAAKLGLRPSKLVMVGDTPYDARAARGAGDGALGLLTGLFSSTDLLDGGCEGVFADVEALAGSIENTMVGARSEVRPQGG
jgi:phosphoglycolate phosphatase-like HAD superfamily hydrolase